MYYLLTRSQIEDALGAAGCTKPGSEAIDQYVTALGIVRTRIEGMMNVRSLVQDIYTDTFVVPDTRQTGHLLRLSNALLPKPLVCTLSDRYGRVLDPEYHTPIRVDRRHGIVHTGALGAGAYTCTYRAGLEADADGFFIDVPEWLTSLAINCIVLWYRLGLLNVRVPKDISYSALAQATVRELQTRLYQTYNRPRVDVLWPEELSYGD